MGLVGCLNLSLIPLRIWGLDVPVIIHDLLSLSPNPFPSRKTSTIIRIGSRKLKIQGHGDLTQEDLMEVLADHYEGTGMYNTTHSNPQFRTICKKRTISAMVAHLKPRLPSEMQLMWYCMSSPCISVFMPVYANVSEIPDPYLTGSGPEDISSYDPSSAWWVFKKLQLSIDENYDELHPVIRAGWDDLYADAVNQTSHLENELLTLFEEKRYDEARRLMDGLVDEKLTEAYQFATETLKELTGVEEEAPSIEEEIKEDEKDKIALYTPLVVVIILIACGTLLYLMKIRKST